VGTVGIMVGGTVLQALHELQRFEAPAVVTLGAHELLASVLRRTLRKPPCVVPRVRGICKVVASN
jgi:hypothetical protein